MTQKKTVPFTPLQQAVIDQFEAGSAIKTITKQISDLIHLCLADQESEGEAAENTHLGRLIQATRQADYGDSLADEEDAVSACPHCSEIVRLHEERKTYTRKRAGARIRLNRIAKSLVEAEQAGGDGNV